MKKKAIGFVVATVAAGLIMSGHVKAEEKAAAPAKVKCTGINECKGKGACKSEENACKGKNSCKGKGVVETSKKECAEKKGKEAK
jgi:hypothetical protein